MQQKCSGLYHSFAAGGFFSLTEFAEVPGRHLFCRSESRDQQKPPLDQGRGLLRRLYKVLRVKDARSN